MAKRRDSVFFDPNEDLTETQAMYQGRYAMEQRGFRLWRNNVGVFKPTFKGARPVRFGLANESSKMNQRWKSADYIGWREIIIRPEDVGKKIAQFASVEFKKPGRSVVPTAQKTWRNLIRKAGGYAVITDGKKEHAEDDWIDAFQGS